MAALVGLDEDTLAKRLLDQPEVAAALARAGARMKASIRRKQVAIALDDKHPAQATMLIWCGKVILGQSERINLKIETPTDAFAKIREIWPELDETELKQLMAGPSEPDDGTIDAEVVEGSERKEIA
jgi:hypothetical protein